MQVIAHMVNAFIRPMPPEPVKRDDAPTVRAQILNNGPHLLRMHESGLSLNEMAAQMKLNPQTCRKYLAEYKWAIREGLA